MTKSVARVTAAISCSAALLAIPACKSLEEGAREAFSREFSCPEGRVVVRPRTDVDAYTATFGAVDSGGPPADVKRDPERYALWQKQQREQHDAWNNDRSVLEARGCDHEVLYTCSHPSGFRGGASASCRAEPGTPSPPAICSAGSRCAPRRSAPSSRWWPRTSATWRDGSAAGPASVLKRLGARGTGKLAVA